MYATLLKREDATIPEEKRPEFERNLKRFLKSAGLCSISTIDLFDRKIPTLIDSNTTASEFTVRYNYVDDIGEEPFGFDKEKAECWSGSQGYRMHKHAVLAAYELQALYTEGDVAVVVDGEPIDEQAYIAWLNDTLGTSFEVISKSCLRKNFKICFSGRMGVW